MKTFDRKAHWEKIYQTKALNEVSWYQSNPDTSLSFFKDLEISKQSKIIDIGGGDSFLVDHLLALGYSDISVLDISESAIERAKKRLGKDNAEKISWIVSDVANFEPDHQYDVWHDRAAFHFLKQQEEIEIYTKLVSDTIVKNGYLIIGTFSDNGPQKCSGIDIQQYSQDSLFAQFSQNFNKLSSFNADHSTPFNTVQNFTFCSFKRQ